MRTLGFAALGFVGLLVGLFLWLEFTAENSQEYALSESAESEAPAKPAATPPEKAKPAPMAPAVRAERPEPVKRPANEEKPAGKPAKAQGTAELASSAGLLEDSRDGPLPRVAIDGRMPWQAYAAKTGKLDDRPKLAIVIVNLGLGRAVTEAAIDELPAYVGLALSPYGRELQNWADRARGDGHEVLLSVPMEPIEYPSSDPGDKGLLTSLNAAENVERLKWMMGRFSGYVGVMSHMGSRFTSSTKASRPVIKELKARGLAYVDNGSAERSAAVTLADEIGVPQAQAVLRVDLELSAGAIDAQLIEAEEIAKKTGAVLIVGFAYPVTIQRVSNWIVTLKGRGISAVPVTALIKAQAKE